MQCTSYYRDPFETAAWQLHLRECALRTAREEVAFLEAVGAATKEELDRIRQRVMACSEPAWDANNMDAQAMNNARLINLLGQNQNGLKREDDDLSIPDNYHRENERYDNNNNNVTVSLKSVLNDIIQSDTVINSLCRRVRPVLEQHGIPTFKKHQAVHVLRVDAQRVRDLGSGLV